MNNVLYESYYGIEEIGTSLSHHGVKGMKWGVRRYQNYDGTRIGVAKRIGNSISERSERRKKKKEMKKASKNRRTLTDAEIRKKIERIKMERQLKQLTEEELHPGRTATKRVLSSTGKKLATTVALGGSLFFLSSLLDPTSASPRKLASYIAPNPWKKK